MPRHIHRTPTSIYGSLRAQIIPPSRSECSCIHELFVCSDAPSQPPRTPFWMCLPLLFPRAVNNYPEQIGSICFVYGARTTSPFTPTRTGSALKSTHLVGGAARM